jgi:hypothetical protein
MMNATRRSRSQARRLATLTRALAKSCEQVLANNLPRVVRHTGRERVWAVGSRTEGGVVWLVTEVPDGQLACDCPAEGICWHKVHASRAIAGEIGHHSAPTRPRIDLAGFDPRALSGRAG